MRHLPTVMQLVEEQELAFWVSWYPVCCAFLLQKVPFECVIVSATSFTKYLLCAWGQGLFEWSEALEVESRAKKTFHLW